MVGVTGAGGLKMTAFLGLVKLSSAYPSAFVFFVGVILVSLFWALFFVPELAGRS